MFFRKGTMQSEVALDCIVLDVKVVELHKTVTICRHLHEEF